MFRRFTVMAAAAALMMSLTVTAATATESSAREAAAADEGESSIVELVATTGQFKTLLRAVREAGLVDAVAGLDDVTVFAPNNRSFIRTASALGVPVGDLIAALSDAGILDDVLLYHVVPVELYSSDVVGFVGDVPTLQGDTIAVDGNALTLNGSTHLVTSKLDIGASNGVIHVIDSVLLPPSIFG